MPDEPGPLTRLRPWASTKELTNPPDADAVPGAGARTSHQVRRLTGYGFIALVSGLVLAAAALGASPNSALATLHGVTAWLANDGNGSVISANGLSGQPDARITLTGAAGHRLKVIQDGPIVLIEDLTTHTLTRIDPAELAIGQTTTLSTAGAQIVVGDGLAYLIDPAAGTAVPISPVTLTVAGAPVSLPAPLGANPGIAGDGTLWVPSDGGGTLVPVRHDAAGTAIPVGHPGDRLSLTLAGGRAVVTDATAGTLTVFAGGTMFTGRATTPAPATARTTINLPSAGGGPVMAPPTANGPVVPLLLSGHQQLVVVNINKNTVATVPLTGIGADRVDTPLVLGSRIYIPDESQGALVVYDTASGALDHQIAIGSGPGPIDAFVLNDVLWANAPDGSRAVCVNSDGSSFPVDKNQNGLPGGPLPAQRSTPPPGGPGSATSGPGGAGGTSGATGSGAAPTPSPGHRGRPQPSATPTPSPSPSPSASATSSPPPPTAPGAPTETSQAGSIVVTFTPVSAGTPLNYTLSGAPAGATVTPAQVSATGPFTFTVTGLSCAQTYGFAVTAVFTNGQATSPAAGAVRPCSAPGTPGNPVPTGVNHGINLTWPAAAANGGTLTYTVAWSGAGISKSQSGVTGTSFGITGLTNQKGYTVTVTAVNEAGSSQAASASVTLSLPAPVGYHIYNNSVYSVNMRSAPNTSGAVLTQFAPNSGAPVTALCQQQGQFVTDPSGSPSGSMWDYVSANGKTGWVSDLYVTTPESVAGNHSSYSDPPLWQCS
jgi:Bacterial SH3 domain/Fibronectin type III domain